MMGTNMSTVISYMWSVLLITLGIEFLIKYKKKDEESSLSFDGGVIALLFVVMLLSGGMSILKNAGVVSALSNMGGGYHTSVPIEQSYELLDEVEEVFFTIPNGSLSIEGTDEHVLSIVGEIKSNHDESEQLKSEFEEDLAIETNGGVFRYSVSPDSHLSWLPWSNNYRLDFTIMVPSSMELQVDLTNGNINVDSVNRDAHVKTTNGDVGVSRINGNLDVQSTNGKLVIEDIKGYLNARTTNGDILIEQVTEDVFASGTNGTIHITSNHVGGDWEIKTTNGKIAVALPDQVDAQIDAETSNGEVRGNVSWIRENEGELFRENSQGSSTLGNGTHSIKLSGSNGAIEVNQNE